MQLWSPERHPRPPRRWQAEALSATLAAFAAGRDGGVVSAIMGAGKTVFVAELCAVSLAWGWQIVVTVPSQHLVTQTVAELAAVLGDFSVGRWDQHGRTRGAVTVACVASLAQLAAEHPGWSPDLWIADEAHGTEAPIVREWVEVAKPQWRVGLSATPYRSDDREALSLFSFLIYEYGAQAAIRDGVLVPWRLHHLSGDGLVDRDEGCTRWILERRGQPGIVSAETIADAEAYAAELVDAGVKAMAVHSKLTRTAVAARLEALRTGRLDCLVHVAILVEGVNLPWLRWLCLRRVRGSRVKFAQEVGRVLRAHPGKDYAEILDPSDLFGLHKLSDAARLGEYLTPEKKKREAVEIIALVDAITGEEFNAELPARDRKRIAASAEAVSWLCASSAALRSEGVAQSDNATARKWRKLPATGAQLGLLGRWSKTMHWMTTAVETRETPELRDLARAYRAVCAIEAAGKMPRRGVVSDLISVAMAMRQETRNESITALRRYAVQWPTNEERAEDAA